MDCPPLRFNPHARLERVDFDGQPICYVLDQALLDPERLVDYAQAEQARFQQAPFNAYPGREMPMPAEFTAGLELAFNGVPLVVESEVLHTPHIAARPAPGREKTRALEER